MSPVARYSQTTARKRSGATFTPPALARLLAERLLADDAGTASLAIADPSCGDGVLLEAALRFRREQGHHGDRVFGWDTNPEAVQQSRRRLGLTPGTTVAEADFLACFSSLPPPERIIANPPWVRTQVLGTERARLLARRFGLRGRLDLSQAFVLAMVEALAPGGRAAVLLPNKLLQTRGAATFREILRQRVRLLEVLDLGDTRLFDAAVLPAMIVLQKDPPAAASVPFRSIYTVAEPRGEAQPVADIPALWHRPGLYGLPDGRTFEVLDGELDVVGPHASWQRGGAAVRAWLSQVAAHTALRLGDIGPVRVGIKSTADPVFVTPDWAAMPESERPELLRPLTTHHRARPFLPLPAGPGGRMVLYPHETVNGERRPVELAAHPRTRAWLEAHRSRLENRTYVKQSGRPWYVIWVPHNPDGWAAPKLVFRDIAPRSTCWLDTEGTVVNGDCYWLAPAPGCPFPHLLLALAVMCSSFVDALYDRVCNIRLYAGRRRYLTQFLTTCPLPDPDRPISREIVADVQLLLDRLQSGSMEDCTDLVEALDARVWTAFGLDKSAPLP